MPPKDGEVPRAMHKMAAALDHTRCNRDGEAPLFNPRRGL